MNDDELWESDAGEVARISLNELDEDTLNEFRAAFPRLFATAGPRLGAVLRQLDAIMTEISPFETLGILSLYCLTTEIGTNPENTRTTGVLQSDVENAQAIALRHPSSVQDSAPFYPGGKDIFTLLPQLRESLDLLAMGATVRKNEADQRKHAIVASLRRRARTIRGWAYADQLRRMLRELFGPLSDRIQDRFDWSPLAIVDWWGAITRELNSRIDRHHSQIHEASTWHVDDLWPTRVRDAFDFLEGPPDKELVRLAQRQEEVRLGFIMHSSDRCASSIFRFTLNELVALYPETVAPTTLTSLLSAWSMKLGDLAGKTAHDLVQENPVVLYPLIEEDGSWYFFLASSAFGHSSLALIERLISDDDGLWREYLDRRAQYLEEQVAQTLLAGLPGATLHRNIRRMDPKDGKRYESDVVLLLDSYAIVAECKAGRLPATARQGKGRALREQISELIAEPAAQARRLADALIGTSGPLDFTDAAGSPIAIDAAAVQRVITLGATLEPFAGLLPRLSEVVSTGLTDQAVEDLTISISLSDLEVVTEILTHPSELLHYLVRRAEMERSTFLAGEELDLLGFYLDTGLNVGESEFDPNLRIQLVGSSDAIDTFYYRRIDGLPAKQPTTRRTGWWTGVLERVESTRIPGWTQIGTAMCNVSPEDQQEFEQKLLELRAATTDGLRPSSNFVHLSNGPPQRQDHFVGLIATSPDSQERRRTCEEAARAVLDQSEADRVIVIALAPLPMSTPYLLLGVYERDS